MPLAIVLQFWAWAAVLRPLKHLMSMRWLVRLVRSRRTCERDPARASAIVRYMSAQGRFPRRAPANCYERSLVAYRLLATAGAQPELRIGVRRPGEGSLDGHVWVVLEGQPVAEAAAFIDRFTPILRVDAAGHFEPLGSTSTPAGDQRWTDLHREPTAR